mgnify:CR=1 FL=1
MTSYLICKTCLTSCPGYPSWGCRLGQISSGASQRQRESLPEHLRSRLFPKQKDNTSRWREVCFCRENLVLICRENPEMVTVIHENWAVARKTLIFSANWFLASANICRKMTFKLYEQLSLLVTVPKRCDARDPARISY